MEWRNSEHCNSVPTGDFLLFDVALISRSYAQRVGPTLSVTNKSQILRGLNKQFPDPSAYDLTPRGVPITYALQKSIARQLHSIALEVMARCSREEFLPGIDAARHHCFWTFYVCAKQSLLFLVLAVPPELGHERTSTIRALLLRTLKLLRWMDKICTTEFTHLITM